MLKTKLKLLFLARNGVKRAEILKKDKVFYHMGEHCYWHPRNIPNETYLQNIHNNVVAADVTFLTHDVMVWMFNYSGGCPKMKNQKDGHSKYGDESRLSTPDIASFEDEKSILGWSGGVCPKIKNEKGNSSKYSGERNLGTPDMASIKNEKSIFGQSGGRLS